MLTYIPPPRADELLYSVLARYMVHTGTLSPKHGLDDLFGDRKVVASVDLPAHLDTLVRRMGALWKTPTLGIIYEHTLFPLYAPFIPEERRGRAIEWMQSEDGKKLHAGLGLSASTIQQPQFLRFCPQCLHEQYVQHGEYHWARQWQAAGINTCSKHGYLQCSTVLFRPNERHLHVAATPRNCLPGGSLGQPLERELGLARYLMQLLNLRKIESPTLHQWTAFYHQIAADAGCAHGAHGAHVSHMELQQLVLAVWEEAAPKCLMQHDDSGMISWLSAIFRKHRKSFSFMQHLMIWSVFLSDRSVAGLISDVKGFSKTPLQNLRIDIDSAPRVSLHENRLAWVALLQQFASRGTKFARLRTVPGQALYSWLYRHDHAWLMQTNQSHRKKHPSSADRLNWASRDRHFYHQLVQIHEACEQNPEPSRHSRNWYLTQLPQKATVEKNLHKLPLCRVFLSKSTESVEEYQLRRCKEVTALLCQRGLKTPRWLIERIAGIDRKRCLPQAKQFLSSMEGLASGQCKDKRHTE